MRGEQQCKGGSYLRPPFASLSLLPLWPRTDVAAIGTEGKMLGKRWISLCGDEGSDAGFCFSSNKSLGHSRFPALRPEFSPNTLRLVLLPRLDFLIPCFPTSQGTFKCTVAPFL